VIKIGRWNAKNRGNEVFSWRRQSPVPERDDRRTEAPLLTGGTRNDRKNCGAYDPNLRKMRDV